MPVIAQDSGLALALLPLPITLAVAAIDLKHRIIPNGLNLALLGLGLAVAALTSGEPWLTAAEALGCAVLVYGIFRGLRALHARLRGHVGLGLGDVKFLAAATPWIGLAGLPIMLLCASVSALALLAVAAVAGRRVGLATRLPFGPFLAFGLHAALLLGPPA